MYRLYFLILLAALLTVSGAAISQALAEPILEVRARIGPWPVISRLIGYRGRIWFANSVKGRNHNSADLWSLDPVTGKVRYERHLYSQDAGIPLVHRGLLYWPFEDSRFSLGWGMVQVTDGQRWQPQLIPTAQIFHTNSLVAWRNRLLAVTSAWRTGLQISGNGGRDWTPLYDHSTPKRRLSRFYEPRVLHDDLYGYLEDPDGIRLVRFTGDAFVAVPGWPENKHFFALTRHQGQIMAVVRDNDLSQIWRTDGQTSEQISDQLAGLRIVDLANDGTRLWAVSREDHGGRLWSSLDGGAWTKHARFSGGQPLSLHVIADKTYVAGAGDDGRGILWGPPGHDMPPSDDPSPLPIPVSRPGGETDWQQIGTELDDVLSDFSSYENHGRGRLRALVFDAVKQGAPPGFFAQRLEVQLPEGTVQSFGGGLTVKAADIGRTILFWGMGLSKQLGVPVAMIGRPWTAPANSFEKYFDPQLAAIWAVAAAGQNDVATLDALIARLDAEGDPLWLRAQVIGVLTALTGKRFAYNTDQWRAWWVESRPRWPK
ncbi:MAG: hypothetical protein GKS00_04515 [Alphaproteobacteria bacterium]|nr:hypothetical protein [Alphaproteobacteria bacterium]